MPNISTTLQKNLLDWTLGGAAPARNVVPPYCGLSLGAPTSISNSEIGTGSNYFRSIMTFGAAATAGGSGAATNISNVSFGTFATAQSISGVFINDSVSSAAGVYLYYGLLAAARTVSSGDSLVIASGALTVTLS